MKDIKELYETLISTIEEMLCTSTAVMAPYPVDVVGRPQPFKVRKSKKKRAEKRAPHTEIFEELEKQKKGSQKKAQLNYKYRKLWNTSNISEVMSEIADTCKKIIKEK